MIVYQATKKGFLDDVDSNAIDTKIHRAFYEHLGRHTSPNEVASWRNSMHFMNSLLIRSAVPDNAGVSIEFQIPLTSKRIDFILTGLDDSKRKNVFIIELKQWEKAQLTDKDAVVKTHFQGGLQETAHPSYQAWSYAQILSNYSETIEQDCINLIPCAYLHNYTPDNVISDKFYSEYINKAPLFLKYDTQKLRNFIEQYIKFGDNKDILYKIENGRIRPSKQLADSLESMLHGNPEFVMIDEQKIIFESAINLAKKAKKGLKHIMIVEGGPGTGKSVVAINLLVEFTKMRYVTKYVSKNSAPRSVYAEILTKSHKKTYINNLFSGSGAFIDANPDDFDMLIVDEAHRLNMKSGLYGVDGENQVLEIIKASKFSIFFVDDNQRIHIKDIGTKAQIENWAKEAGGIVSNFKLDSQFRCNGSDGYLAWIDNSLQIRNTANFKLSPDSYDFRIFSDPNEMRRLIIEKNKIRNKARIVAGYCWDWNSKKDAAAYDIVIPEFDFKMKWNLSEDGPAWLVRPNSIDQAGCIHTCQGLELDYIGVIVGNDIKLIDNKIVTDIKARSIGDSSIKGLKKMIKENPAKGHQIAEQIIKNTYRTLFTRGMKGCYVYFCDTALAEHFKSLIKYEDTTSSFANSKIDEQDLESARIEADVNEDVKFMDFLPYYSIKAACGAFGDCQDVMPLGWIKVDNLGTLKKNMFIVKAVGHSMEPKIKDGDLCVFRTNVAGSRTNKIVLIQHYSYYDSENQGSFSIKKYTSEKKFDSFTGEWEHERIVLQPLNDKYAPIVIEEEDGYMVIGEFIGKVE